MISLNVTYYNEPTWLKWWYDLYHRMNDQGINFYLNVCDDGSQKEPATAFFEKHAPQPYMRLFRVTEDIGFNSHGARNLLMKTTKTDWNLLSDIDRRYPDETISGFARKGDKILKQGVYYSLYEIVKVSPDRYSVNDYIVHKDDFWKVGGYDEEYVNIHFGDRDFLEGLRHVARRSKVSNWKVKYARGARNVEWSDDVAITQYPDDSTLIHPNNRWTNPEYRKSIRAMIRERYKTEEGRLSKKTINFPWEQVF